MKEKLGAQFSPWCFYLQLENNFTDHMPLKEMTIKLPHPSEPTSVNGIKEHIIDIDGEIYPLKQPQFTIR